MHVRRSLINRYRLIRNLLLSALPLSLDIQATGSSTGTSGSCCRSPDWSTSVSSLTTSSWGREAVVRTRRLALSALIQVWCARWTRTPHSQSFGIYSRVCTWFFWTWRWSLQDWARPPRTSAYAWRLLRGRFVPSSSHTPQSTSDTSCRGTWAKASGASPLCFRIFCRPACCSGSHSLRPFPCPASCCTLSVTSPLRSVCLACSSVWPISGSSVLGCSSVVQYSASHSSASKSATQSSPREKTRGIPWVCCSTTMPLWPAQCGPQ